MSSTLLCDQCLKPLDEDGRCEKHAFAEALDPGDPQDASFIATRRELMGRRRRPLAWMAFGLVAWLLVLLFVAPTTPVPSWNTQLAIPVMITMLYTTTLWALLMGCAAVLLTAGRRVEGMVRGLARGEVEADRGGDEVQTARRVEAVAEPAGELREVAQRRPKVPVGR